MAEPHETVPFRRQFIASVRRNAVALISLTVALFGTSYNTWRNQTTEAHRNTRAAGFMVLETLGQLQEIADRRYYGGDHSDENRLSGWGKVTVIRDMSTLVSVNVDTQGHAVFAAWQENVDKLDTGDAQAEESVTRAISALRDGVIADLRALN
ncbi:MAG: hypothetical protein ABIR62_06275 [Dokdonella sp.]|uniref:hypothetical protein n=1 Tax=Dokdonella sp. TaxID=2291710 RepID=UPI003262E0A6